MNTVFVDTSVLVAAEDTGQGALHAAVLQWLDLLWRTRSGRTGSQSLCEFYEQVTTAAQPLPQGDARAAIRRYQTWTPWKTDAATLERSEEHTSELQSPCNIVCRLLLEKKKNTCIDQFLYSACIPICLQSPSSTYPPVLSARRHSTRLS